MLRHIIICQVNLHRAFTEAMKAKNRKLRQKEPFSQAVTSTLARVKGSFHRQNMALP